VFVFIDEIQYLDNPSAILKYAFDHFKHIKLIVSGSSSLEIKKKFSDRLTGRKFLQILSPIGFSEFLRFQGKRFKIKEEISFQKLAKSNLRINDGLKKAVSWAEKDLSVALQEFVLFGGYPKVALIDNKQEKVNILKEIYSTYVRKDIKDLAEIENIKIYNDLIEILASQTANLLNIDELASTLSANRKTLEKYLFLLENTFIIGLLRPFYTNKRKEITKMPKIFMEDTGLRNMLLRNFNGLKLRPDKGPLIENFVYTELKKNLGPLEDIYFWRTQTQAEVDFVIKGKQNQLTPVEVKYQKLKSPQIPSGLRAFIEAYKVKKAFVITENFLSQTKTGKTTVYFLPAYLL
ncbi:DUF4143 domain-containing protein, partial [Candidatus Gribaldobacteria bacterium]|nr:DUF4143 domain-containing protein [Candidatus Gribaldobacteria bacterium]